MKYVKVNSPLQVRDCPKLELVYARNIHFMHSVIDLDPKVFKDTEFFSLFENHLNDKYFTLGYIPKGIKFKREYLSIKFPQWEFPQKNEDSQMIDVLKARHFEFKSNYNIAHECANKQKLGEILKNISELGDMLFEHDPSGKTPVEVFLRRGNYYEVFAFIRKMKQNKYKKFLGV